MTSTSPAGRPHGTDAPAGPPRAPGAYATQVRLSGLARLLALDVALPLAGFYLSRAAGASVMAALVVATLVSAARNLWQVARHRRLDGFSALVLGLLAGALAVSFATGDPRFMLLRACLVGIVAGAAFTISALVRRPLSFTIAKRLAGSDEAAQAELARGWAESPDFRRGFVVMSLVWGIGLIAETVLRILNIYVLIEDIDKVVLANAVVHGGSIAAMAAWNIWYIRRSRREALLDHPDPEGREDLAEATDALLT